MRRADELLPEAPKPKRGRPPKAKAQALANYDAGDVERPAGERWVTMSNALTRAGHGLTLAEKRIVAAAVSKLDSRKALPPGEVPRTKLTQRLLAGLRVVVGVVVLDGHAVVGVDSP